MTIGPTGTFWIVVNPGPLSELADCCFKTTVRELENLVRGGLPLGAGDAVLCTDQDEAVLEARRRLLARDVASAIRSGHLAGPAEAVTHVTLEDGRGVVVMGARLDGR